MNERGGDKETRKLDNWVDKADFCFEYREEDCEALTCSSLASMEAKSTLMRLDEEVVLEGEERLEPHIWQKRKSKSL